MPIALDITPHMEAVLTAEAVANGFTLPSYLLLIIQDRKQTIGVSLRLSLLGALVGTVTPNLFAVTAGMVDNTIKIHAFFDEIVSEDDRDNISCVAAEVIADYPEGIAIHESCFSRQDTPLEMLDFWVFMREY